jgi:hypothetical protein
LAAPSIATTALICAVILVLAAVLAAIFGMETRKRGLEEITASEYALPLDDRIESALAGSVS